MEVKLAWPLQKGSNRKKKREHFGGGRIKRVRVKEERRGAVPPASQAGSWSYQGGSILER